jgi:hypothetical protein
MGMVFFILKEKGAKFDQFPPFFIVNIPKLCLIIYNQDVDYK